MSSILENIGGTPLVRLERIMKAEGLQCEVLAKCEFFNSGGSVKDRIGFRMIDDAELSGRIKPGDTLIEPTSGNTGIGMALTAAIKGYRMIITLPEKMSQEKVDVLKALGAEIIRTPTEAAFDSPESHIGVAKRLEKELPRSHILDQYANPSNPIAHYDGTAVELIEQCDNKIDVVVVAAGTGGTITGIARRLKESIPNVKVIGVDPHGSILAQPESLNSDIKSYKVEGIGYDFIPNVLDRGLIDGWVKTDDKESFLMARRLIREEGLLVGGSAGSAMVGALKIAKTLEPGKRLVVLLADSVRNYMSKFLNDGWMEDNGFAEPESEPSSAQNQWWSAKTVADLKLQKATTVKPSVTCAQCVELFNATSFDQIPCVDDNGAVLGVATLGDITSKLTNGRLQPTDPVEKALFRGFKQVSPVTTLSTLSRIFDRHHFVLVTEGSSVVGVATRIDLTSFIVKSQ